MNVDQNIKDYEEIYKKYRAKREKILGMGGEKTIKKQHDSGKLTARERLEYFFDDGVYTETGLYVEHRTTAFGLDKKKFPRKR